ncbi:MAG: dihydroorotase [Treponema sp.]|jgi:dihydroorotase|nr:dihydroorotase [Treponema sp.]
MKTVLEHLRIIDEAADIYGAVVIEDGIIQDVIAADGQNHGEERLAPHRNTAARIIDGRMMRPGQVLTLMPALVDLHAHFRDPGFPDKETLESASLAAVAGGYGTVVCMANTKAVIDTLEKAQVLKARSVRLGLIDLYPVMALTQDMAGRVLSGITQVPAAPALPFPRMLSEDGRDVADDRLLLGAFREARRLGLPVSCHCDAGGFEAEAAKRAGKPRELWSRIEENVATRRAIALGKQAQCHVHIAHVSTKEAVELIRETKATLNEAGGSFTLSCEATPHHLTLTEEDACVLGAESWGRVNPPLRTEADRQALIAAILDGTIDAIATDHAPHTEADKIAGAPGFTGLETGFAVARTELVRADRLDLSRLSSLMSAAPARILGLGDRGRITPGNRADLIIVDSNALQLVNPGAFRSRGKNSPFEGQTLRGTVLMTLQRGRVVFEAP